MRKAMLLVFALGIVLVVSGCTALEKAIDPCEREYENCVAGCADYSSDLAHDLCVSTCKAQKNNCQEGSSNTSWDV